MVADDKLPDADAVGEFRARGCWIARGLLAPEVITDLADGVARALRGERDFDAYHWLGPPQPVGRLELLAGAWWVSEPVRRMVFEGALGAVAARLLAVDEIRLFFDQALGKPPSVGPDANVGWHQDAAHWEILDSTELVTAWIPLQPVDEHNGTLRVVEGSHLWGRVPGAHTFADGDLDGLRARYIRDDRPWRERALTMQVGDVSFHHALTFHASAENRSDRTRRALSVSLMPAGTRMVAGKRYHQAASLLGPAARAGDEFEGPFFPRVWPVCRR